MRAATARLALRGGTPVRQAPLPVYPPPGSADEIEAAARVLRSGNLTATRGPEVEEFGEAFAAYNGAKHAVAVSNGTTALHAALAAARIGVGDEVIVPALTFLASATSVLMNNAIPIFADIEPETLGLDPVSVRSRITERTRAIIIVHLNGYPADMDGLLAAAREHGLTVIEDCAHAHGALFGSRKVGVLGDMGCFSFQHKKNLSLGEGGAVITNDDGLAQRLRQVRNFGTEQLGYNYRMTELHAAIGKLRLARLDQMNAQRRANAAHLDEHLAALPGLTPQRPRTGTTSVYYNYMLRYDPDVIGVSRDRFAEALVAEGVVADPPYQPIYNRASFQARDCYGRGCPFACPLYCVPEQQRQQYTPGLCPTAEEASCRTRLGVKIHPPCAEAEMGDVAAAFVKVMANRQELQ